ncbi:MAG: hypothetical protein M1835_002565, partial [Candelina submexicana]
ENVDLDEMVQERRIAEDRLGVSQSQTSQLPIAAIIQCPCIAIRYKMRSGQMRRFQLRCKTESDYKAAIDTLKQVGLPLKESFPQRSAAVALGPPIRPASSSSQARPSSSASQARHLTSRGTYTATSPLEPLQDRYNVEARNPGSDGHYHPQSSTVAYNNKLGSFTTVPRLVEEASHTLFPTFGQPSIMLSCSTTGIQEESRPPPSAYPPPWMPKIHSDWPIGRPYTSSGLSQGTMQYEDSFRAQNSMLPPAEGQGVTKISYPVGSIEPEHPSRLGSDVLQRPATAPVSQAETLSQLLPPKRELPFGKRLSKLTPASTDPMTRPPASVLDMPPLPTPTIVEKTEVVSTNKRSSAKKTAPISRSRKAPNPRGKSRVKPNRLLNPQVEIKPFGEAHEEEPAKPPLLAAETGLMCKDHDAAQRASKRKLNDLGGAVNNRRKSDPKRCVLESDKQASPNAIETDPSPLTNTVPDPSSTIPVNSTTEMWMDRVDAFVARHAGRPSPMQAIDLSAYAAQSDEDRLAQVDNMICDYIMDDDFLKLCEDVESSWRRIALGY